MRLNVQLFQNQESKRSTSPGSETSVFNLNTEIDNNIQGEMAAKNLEALAERIREETKRPL